MRPILMIRKSNNNNLTKMLLLRYDYNMCSSMYQNVGRSRRNTSTTTTTCYRCNSIIMNNDSSRSDNKIRQQQQQQAKIGMSLSSTTAMFHTTAHSSKKKKNYYDIDTTAYNSRNKFVDENNKKRHIYGNALVIGSSGILGTQMKDYLLNELYMNVLCADIVVPTNDNNYTTQQLLSTTSSNNKNDTTVTDDWYKDSTNKSLDDSNNNDINTPSYFPNKTNRGPLNIFCQLPSAITTTNNATNDDDDDSTTNTITSSQSSSSSSLTSLTHTLIRSVHDFTQQCNPKHPYLDVIIVTSGGFEMDPIPNPSPVLGKNKKAQQQQCHDLDAILQSSTQSIESMERMYTKNFHPVYAASIVAQQFLNPNTYHVPRNDTNDNDDNDIKNKYMKGTLFVVMGAAAALQPTPGMIGYGTCKNAVHYLIQTLGVCTGGIQELGIYNNLKTLEPIYGGGPITNLQDSKRIRHIGRTIQQSIPSYNHCTIVGILPSMIDTPNNRESIIKEITSSPSNSTTTTSSLNGQQVPVTKEEQIQERIQSTLVAPMDIVTEIASWITTPALRPHSGAYIKVTPSTTIVQQQQTSIQQKDVTTASSSTSKARFELVR